MDEVYRDTTGDGYSIDDIFGAMGGDDPIHFLFNGAGERFCRTDPDEYLVYTFYSERGLDVIDAIVGDLTTNPAYLSSLNYADANTLGSPFQNDLIFFKFGLIKDVSGMRSMLSPYGILPIPQYEESQKQYYSEISPHHGSLFAVPRTAVIDSDEEEIVGVALEDLAYISSYLVYPELYNVVLEGKGTRDQESREMLKLIFDTRMFDIGIIFDFARFADHILRCSGKNISAATYWAEEGDAVEQALSDTVEALMALE